MTAHRVGLIVPSSNTTMETELPAILARAGTSCTFHSARMRMTQVTPEALAAMDASSDDCAVHLADAECDVLAYACLVAIMAAGPGAHGRAEQRLREASGGRPVVTSAGALVDGIRTLGARRVAMVAPYAPPLTQRVVDYLRAEEIEVVARVSLGVTDNCAVGRLDPSGLLQHVARLDLRRADAVVLSACVQMPSLPAIAAAEELTGRPVLTAATATARGIIDALGIDVDVPGGGALLRSAVSA